MAARASALTDDTMPDRNPGRKAIARPRRAASPIAIRLGVACTRPRGVGRALVAPGRTRLDGSDSVSSSDSGRHRPSSQGRCRASESRRCPGARIGTTSPARRVSRRTTSACRGPAHANGLNRVRDTPRDARVTCITSDRATEIHGRADTEQLRVGEPPREVERAAVAFGGQERPRVGVAEHGVRGGNSGWDEATP